MFFLNTSVATGVSQHEKNGLRLYLNHFRCVNLKGYIVESYELRWQKVKAEIIIISSHCFFGLLISAKF